MIDFQIGYNRHLVGWGSVQIPLDRLLTRELVHTIMRYTEDERRPSMTPELEALHARALLEAGRRRILRDGFKASIEQLALSTRCWEDR